TKNTKGPMARRLSSDVELTFRNVLAASGAAREAFAHPSPSIDRNVLIFTTLRLVLDAGGPHLRQPRCQGHPDDHNPDHPENNYQHDPTPPADQARCIGQQKQSSLLTLQSKPSPLMLGTSNFPGSRRRLPADPLGFPVVAFPLSCGSPPAFLAVIRPS